MFNRNKAWRLFLCLNALIIMLSVGLFLSQASVAVVAAQSTSDTLPTRTPTATQPAPTTTATSTAPAGAIWIGRVVDRIPGFTNGGGSVFRVSVQGVDGTPIELRLDDQLIAANSGSKPEFGPYAAEFAPVTEGTWSVSVPSLDVSMNVTADPFSLVIIEFVEVTAAEATQAAVTPATPTPLGSTTWEGEVTEEAIGAGGPFARLLIKVVGREAQPVQLSTLSQVLNTASTGQKPDELGPNTVEFAGLTPGKYIIEPLGLNISLEVELKPDIVTQVEFRPQADPPTPTATATADFTLTPIGAIPSQSLPSATPTPLPAPTQVVPEPSPVPISRWLGVVAERAEAGLDPSSVTVTVDGVADVPVRLSSIPDETLFNRRCTTGQDGADPDSCTFDEVEPGRYVVEAEGFALSLPVMLYAHEKVNVRFFAEELPPEVVGWTAAVSSNTNGFTAHSQAASQINIRTDGDDGTPGLVISLHSVQEDTRYCELAQQADGSGLACQFGRLRAGVYRVVAETTGASTRIFVDGQGLAEIDLAPDATLEKVAQTLSAPVVGQGAQPDLPPPTAAPVTQAAAEPPTATVELTPTLVATPTPAFEWQVRVVETAPSGVGSVGVRVVDRRDQPVILRSGDWSSEPQLTGSKPEHGDYAVEFGGLSPGDYIIELVDLTEHPVRLEPGRFILIEFDYVPVE